MNDRLYLIHQWDRRLPYRIASIAALRRVMRLTTGAVFLGAALSMVTSEQREACTPDAMKLCSDFIPDPGRVKGCLIQHVAALSLPCRGVFEKHRGSDSHSTLRSPRKDD
jgi:hypothetical protein